jgi:hypothetical protein
MILTQLQYVELRVTLRMVYSTLMVVTSVHGGLVDGRSCYGLNHSTRMHGWSAAMYHGVESIVCVSRVGHSADSTIRLHQAVLSLHHVTIALLPLALNVSSMRVIHTVVEAVLRIRLKVYTCIYAYLRRNQSLSFLQCPTTVLSNEQ